MHLILRTATKLVYSLGPSPASVLYILYVVSRTGTHKPMRVQKYAYFCTRIGLWVPVRETTYKIYKTLAGLGPNEYTSLVAVRRIKCISTSSKIPSRFRTRHQNWSASVSWRSSYKRSEEHTSELQSPCNLVCRLLLEKKNINHDTPYPITPTYTRGATR